MKKLLIITILGIALLSFKKNKTVTRRMMRYRYVDTMNVMEDYEEVIYREKKCGCYYHDTLYFIHKEGIPVYKGKVRMDTINVLNTNIYITIDSI